MENMDIVQLVNGLGGSLGTLLVAIIMLFKILQHNTQHLDNQKEIKHINEKIKEHFDEHKDFTAKITQNTQNIDKLALIIERHDKEIQRHEKQLKNLKQYKKVTN